MKNIKLFEDFINEASEEEPVVDNEEGAKPEEDAPIDVEIPQRNSAVVTKKFFNELEHNLHYWFKNGDIKKKYDLVDIDQESRGITIWMQDRVDNVTETPKYIYKIKYYESDPKGMVDKVDDVLMSIYVYNHDKTDKLKEMTIQIGTKNINEEFLMERIERIVKKIVRDPKDDKEHGDFMDRQHTRLTDEFY